MSTPYVYRRTIRFHETDAAGVVYFANVLILCHEAYEASLVAAGVDVRIFFSGGSLAVPIVHSSVDFRRPLHCGDEVAIALQTTALDDATFEIRYALSTDQKSIATALTRHVCIDSASRQRQPISPDLQQWLRLTAPSSQLD
ncbi:MAG: thioesterase family protein [Cyanobacteria bacterium P01_D01_bin.156]